MFDWNALAANRRIQLLAAVILVTLCLLFLRDGNPATVDLNQGIEFVGGVRIPVTLERSVDPVTMDSMVEIIKGRINKYGLSQAVVRPLGDKDIIVEIPYADESVIANVERLLREQGKFEAIIDGKEALSGTDIMPSSVGGGNSEGITSSAGRIGWELGFAATRAGADKFAAAARGKAYYPVYMSLDRPSNAAIVVDKSWHNSTQLAASYALVEDAMRAALRKDGDDIELVYVDSIDAAGLANKTMVVADSKLEEEQPLAYAAITRLGFSTDANATKRLVLRERADMVAPTMTTEQGETIVSEWRAIGLISSPTLSPGLANGYVGQFYQVTGSGRGDTPDEQRKSAVDEIKLLKTVISGGKLPVSTFIGSTYSIAPSLGRTFFAYSAVGILLSVAVVAALIVLRYRRPVLAIPIIFVNVVEMLCTLVVVGVIGTIDLAGMAGVITLIGTGVDDQIIITDEMLRKRHEGEGGDEEEPSKSARQRLGRAFEIVLTTASIAIATMVPLLLSGMVEITGFALSVISGIAVGQLITRPAYGVIIGEIFKKDKAEGRN